MRTDLECGAVDDPAADPVAALVAQVSAADGRRCVAMSASTIVVALNAQLLRRVQPRSGVGPASVD